MLLTLTESLLAILYEANHCCLEYGEVGKTDHLLLPETETALNSVRLVRRRNKYARFIVYAIFLSMQYVACPILVGPRVRDRCCRDEWAIPAVRERHDKISHVRCIPSPLLVPSI